MLFQGAKENAESDGTSRPAAPGKKKQATKQGFRLSHEPQQSEELQREKEHKDVKVALFMLCFKIYL